MTNWFEKMHQAADEPAHKTKEIVRQGKKEVGEVSKKKDAKITTQDSGWLNRWQENQEGEEDRRRALREKKL